MSTEPRRVGVVFGTRPEAIKLAPVIQALRDSAAWDPTVIVTGQHREMLDAVLGTFAITADADLAIFAPGQSLSDITTRVISRLPAVLEAHACDLVIVQGDTTTTFASALAAFYAGIDVAHVEAGLRTWNPRAPFPEEINRRLTTQLASFHFAPTVTSRDNLLRENVAPDRITVSGNTVIDALAWAVDRELEQPCELLARLSDETKRVLLVTAHRRESWGAPLRSIARALARLASSEPDLVVVIPAHPNPLVRDTLTSVLQGHPNVLVTDPLPYLPFVHLLVRADIVLTDSGGIQEEAPSLGKPVLVLRETTERPEAVEAGTVELIGVNEDAIVQSVASLLHDDGRYRRMAQAINPYGDGRAAARIVDALDFHYGEGRRPDDFDGRRS